MGFSLWKLTWSSFRVVHAIFTSQRRLTHSNAWSKLQHYIQVQVNDVVIAWWDLSLSWQNARRIPPWNCVMNMIIRYHIFYVIIMRHIFLSIEIEKRKMKSTLLENANFMSRACICSLYWNKYRHKSQASRSYRAHFRSYLQSAIANYWFKLARRWEN